MCLASILVINHFSKHLNILDGKFLFECQQYCHFENLYTLTTITEVMMTRINIKYID